MNKKLKIFFFIFASLLGLFFVCFNIFMALNSDISDAELGPSPYKINEAITAEKNPELQKIADIAKEIQGQNDFDTKFMLEINNPQPSILLLQDFLEKNKKLLNNFNLDLFKACKFPKPSLNMGDQLGHLKNLNKLYQNKITLEILTNDHENAKSDLTIINQINNDLAIKVPDCLSGMIILQIRSIELQNVKLLLNQEMLTPEQKLAILDIQQTPISSQFLKTIAYFESDFINRTLQGLLKDNVSESKKFSFKDKLRTSNLFPYHYAQPNKSEKLYREIANKIISNFEDSMNPHEDLKKIKVFKNVRFYTPNSIGIIMVSMVAPIFNLLPNKLIIYNNFCNQLLLAKQILTYQKQNGSFPKTLEELSLDIKLITDICTGNPFLYSSENGILQSIGGDKINGYPDLTSKALTKQEIRDILNNEKNNDDFILYLK